MTTSELIFHPDTPARSFTAAELDHVRAMINQPNFSQTGDLRVCGWWLEFIVLRYKDSNKYYCIKVTLPEGIRRMSPEQCAEAAREMVYCTPSDKLLRIEIFNEKSTVDTKQLPTMQQKV